MTAGEARQVGVFTTDRELVVTSWDAWMEAATGVPAARANGRRIDELYPELAERGITGRVERVIRQGTFEVLAAAFHKYLIPCAPREPSAHFDRMRQFVTIAPIRAGDTVTGVAVTIEDVTPRLEHERQLLMQLRSGDEEERLRAATKLASSSANPGLLAEGMRDRSWRVRRVTAEGLGAAGGSETAGALVEALREHHHDPSVLSATLGAIVASRDDLVALLISLLDRDDADLRTYVALALGLLRDPRAVPSLLALLGDGNTNVRYHAIEALGRIGDRSAAEALARIAATRDFFLSFAAIDALSAIGEPSVAPRLLPLLDDPVLAGPTATCLGAIGSEDVVGTLAAHIGAEDAPTTELSRGLATLYGRVRLATGEGAIVADIARGSITAGGAQALLDALPGATGADRDALVTVLGWLRVDGVDARLAALLSDADGRHHIADVLATRGSRAISALVDAGADLDAEGQKLVAMALGRIGSADGVPFLIKRLDGDPPVAIAAAAALGAIGDRSAFDHLRALLDHPVDAVRRAAIGALNSIGHPDMERLVRQLLRDASPRRRESGARIAGYFGYPSCLDDMLALVNDGDEGVRRAVAEHVINFDDPRVTRATLDLLHSDASASVRAAAARALPADAGSSSLGALVAACGDADVWVRYYALRGLARRANAHPQVIATVAALAREDPAPPVRIAAVEAMAEMPQPAFQSALVERAGDAEPEVSYAAIRAMGAFDGAGVRAVLSEALASDDPARRAAALQAVARQRSDEWIPALRALAAESDPDLRRACVLALRDIGSAPAITALIQLAESMQARPTVLGALSTLEAPQVESLGDALAYENEGIRCMVVEALGRMKHPAVARLLVAALDDPASSVRLAATQALARLDLRDAKGQLARMARTDASDAVRAAASSALAQG